MGNVISLAAYRSIRTAARAAGAVPDPRRRRFRARATVFSFDVVSPWTYLAAERVERLFADARWEPVDGGRMGLPAEDRGRLRARAETRAAELRLPLVWPEREGGQGARRAASFAADHGRGREFALAAGRLAFCGGFPLDEPDVLAEAAGAAGLSPAAVLTAAAAPGWDAALAASSARLAAREPRTLPALRVGEMLVCGEDQLAAALASAAG